MPGNQPDATAGQPEPTMMALSIFIRAGDCYGGRPLHSEIIDRAMAAGLTGATTFTGLQGFGASRHMHAPGLIRAGPGVPIRIDIAASAEQVRAFLPVLDVVLASGLVTVRLVDAAMRRTATKASPGPARTSKRPILRGR
jgi:PII-like signaling protein